MEKTSDHQVPQGEISRPRRLLFAIFHIPCLIWEFTESNFATFVIPNTTFGVLGALAGSRLADGRGPSVLQVLQRLPIAVAFNWYNVLIFDLANQRSEESIQEDLINKPWRPIPSGKVTGQQTRRSMLVAVPMAIALNYYLGVPIEGHFIQVLTWLYNDLKGGDEVVRDLIISIAYGFFNHGSLSIMLGTQANISQEGLAWILIASSVILTTMQVQDLKDMAGDRIRSRLSIPLLLGEQFSRKSIALFVLTWSCICSYFWNLGPWAYGFVLLMGAIVSANALFRTTPREDATTWKLWCFWTMCLYLLPLFATLANQREPTRGGNV